MVKAFVYKPDSSEHEVQRVKRIAGLNIKYSTATAFQRIKMSHRDVIGEIIKSV